MNWGCLCGIFLVISVVFGLSASYFAFYAQADPEAAQRRRGHHPGMQTPEAETHCEE